MRIVNLDEGSQIALFDPARPIYEQQPFLTLNGRDVFVRRDEHALFLEMMKIARRVFLILEKA
ncbi:hypothetical protein COU19_00125 [Candidatus Kaiserbacteria bacterium CG10_big_fil_rev_8_21_14_0_10_56_12]|uniref:Uncharacterized protein n=1 Tax=Candidatus Kaiserbacteria bacterium CG10_big_fil_rev_8_21_14_0_10_56_12 TaxID=1974611 RepID=A0A2H0UCJ7_9BACT|nr:MAG: hypothetical protein COU19_00125 [Candidatus Kaiserbacteria bacterium CG10_big_fil_rev_8_21_14_0_10_56_12]